MGFEPQIREILKRVPRRRQTLMFSATWPEEVRRLAHDFLTRPVHIQVTSQENPFENFRHFALNFFLYQNW